MQNLQQANFSREQLTEVEDQEIAKLVQAQLDAGIQVITDGEYRRAFWHIDFLENLNGIEGYHLNTVINLMVWNQP